MKKKTAYMMALYGCGGALCLLAVLFTRMPGREGLMVTMTVLVGLLLLILIASAVSYLVSRIKKLDRKLERLLPERESDTQERP